MCLSSATDLHLIPWSFILRLNHSTHSSPPAHFSIFSLINHQEHSFPLPPSSILPFLSISHKRAVCHPSVPFPLSVSHSSRLIHPFPPLHLHISPQISWFHHSIPLSFHQLWALSPLACSPPSVLASASFTLGLYSEWLHAWLTHSWTPLCRWRTLDARPLASNATSSRAHTSPACINNRRRNALTRSCMTCLKGDSTRKIKIQLLSWGGRRWINTNYI